MAPELRTASPASDPDLVERIEAIFQRSGHEATLAVELARGHPRFDPSLSLCAEVGGETAGWAMVLPTSLRLRGALVPLGIVGPYGTLPQHQGTGVGRYLIEVATSALADRGLRGAIAIGDPRFLGRMGFRAAFNRHDVQVSADLLPEEGDTSGWVALDACHLSRLVELHARSYGHVSGAEQRTDAVVDWACLAPGAHMLVWEHEGETQAYLRFAAREHLAVTECGAHDRAGVAAILSFLRRLAREHQRSVVEVSVPPTHPVGRELFHHGCSAAVENLGGASMLFVRDWRGLLEDVGASWLDALDGPAHGSFSLEIGGHSYRVVSRGESVEVEAGRDEECHVELPDELAPGLITGQRTWLDLLDAGSVRPGKERLLAALFPGGDAMWTCSSAYEIAMI